jgi:lipoprotein NlpI
MIQYIVETEYESLIESARQMIDLRQWDKAQSLLKQAIGIEPDNPEAFNLLGVARELNGEMILAKKMYRAAIAVDPSYHPATQNLDRTSQWEYTKEGINLG